MDGRSDRQAPVAAHSPTAEPPAAEETAELLPYQSYEPQRGDSALDSDSVLDSDGAPDLGGAIDMMISETGGALAGVGLTHAQFVLLLAVSEFEPVTLEILGWIMAVGERRQQAELTPLIEKGAILLCGEETSECSAVTTAHGRSLLQRAIPLWEAAQERIQDRLLG